LPDNNRDVEQYEVEVAQDKDNCEATEALERVRVVPSLLKHGNQ